MAVGRWGRLLRSGFCVQAYDVVMEKPLRLVGVLALIGLVLGAVYGFVIALSSSCVVDGVGLPAEATCYRFLGRYFSEATAYTVGAGLGGFMIGLASGLIVMIPLLLWRRDDEERTGHLLENPLVWFGLQIVELAIVVPALLFWIPDPGDWPEVLRWAVAVVALVALTYANYVLRRRFLPKRHPLAVSQ